MQLGIDMLAIQEKAIALQAVCKPTIVDYMSQQDLFVTRQVQHRHRHHHQQFDHIHVNSFPS